MKNRVAPAWIFPSLLVVVAVAAIVFSAVSTGWWRMLVGPRDGVLPVASVADLKEPVDAGESAAGEDSDVGGVGVDIFASSDIVETGAGEVSAGETDGITGASDEDAGDEVATEPGDPGEIGGTAEEAATRYAGTPAPSASEPDLVDSGQDRPAISGPGGPYRAVVLSSRNEDLASADVPRLAERGFSAEVIPVDIGDGGLWYRVVVRGGYPALDSARDVVDELKRFGYESAWVHRE